MNSKREDEEEDIGIKRKGYTLTGCVFNVLKYSRNASLKVPQYPGEK